MTVECAGLGAATLCKIHTVENVRITLAVATLLRVFLDDVEEPRYGYDLMRETGFPSGKLYPILARLQAAGWLIKEAEQIDPAEVGRPARRIYRLAPDAMAPARRAVAETVELVTSRRHQGVVPKPAGGIA